MRGLLVSLVALAALAGCADDNRPMRPPGGGGGGGVGGADAGDISDGGADSSGRVTGQICPIADLRFPSDCRPGDLSAVRVAVRGTPISATTGAAGTFSLDLTGLDVESVVLEIASGSSPYHPSLVPVALEADGETSIDAPVMTQADYAALVTALDVAEPAGHGALALYLFDANTRAVGAVVEAPKGTVNEPLYDTAAPDIWVPATGTGTAGATLVFGIPEGTVSVVARDAGATQQLTIGAIPITDGFLTWISDSF